MRLTALTATALIGLFSTPALAEPLCDDDPAPPANQQGLDCPDASPPVCVISSYHAQVTAHMDAGASMCSDMDFNDCTFTCIYDGVIEVQGDASEITQGPWMVLLGDRSGSTPKTHLFAMTHALSDGDLVYTGLVQDVGSLGCTIESAIMADVDRSGEPDVLLGGPTCGSRNEGAVYVFLDPGSSGVLASRYDVQIKGGARDLRIGEQLGTKEEENPGVVWVGNTSGTYAWTITDATFSTRKTTITDYPRTSLTWSRLKDWTDFL